MARSEPFEESTEWEDDPEEDGIEMEEYYKTALTTDPERRRIYFYEGIEGALVRELIPALHHLNHLNPDEPIWLHCGSPGGGDIAMSMIADAVVTLSAPVNLMVYGALSSAATILYGVCEERLVGPFTQTTLHAFKVSPSGDGYASTDAKATYEDMVESAERWASCLADRLRYGKAVPALGQQLTYSILLAIAKGELPEVRLVGREIVEAGLADAVVPSRFSMS